MKVQERSTTIRASFDVVVKQLCAELKTKGFDICGTLIVNSDSSDVGPGKYQVLSVNLPRLSSRMLALPFDGTSILPGCISVVEVCPGDILVSIINPTQLIASEKNNDTLNYLAMEMTTAMEEVVSQIAQADNAPPDLITSWQ